MKRLTAAQYRPLASGERGRGDEAPPRRAGAAARPMRAHVVQPRTATQPRITKRLIRVNYSPGRSMPIEMITDHVTEGSAASVVSWFNDSRAEASAHYQVRKNGDIDQFVEEADRAWHNGRVHEPIAKLVRERPSVNPNAYSIGIEHEGKGTEELTPAQRASTLWLHRDIMRRYPRITLDRKHVVGHREVYGRKTCPGGIDVSRIVRELQAIVNPLAPRPRVVYSKYFDDYLIVTEVASDTEWYFVPAKELSGTGARSVAPERAQTPLSRMPLEPA